MKPGRQQPNQTIKGLTLSEKPMLAELQQYVAEMEVQRGFDKESVRDKCLLLGEEVGELFKAIRKHQKMGLDQNSAIGTTDEELVDILIYICAIANRCNIDLEGAFREKEKMNKKRLWK